MDIKLSEMYPGFTLMICFGKYAGFHIRNVEDTFGICLGWMAITCYNYDYEQALLTLIREDEPIPIITK